MDKCHFYFYEENNEKYPLEIFSSGRGYLESDTFWNVLQGTFGVSNRLFKQQQQKTYPILIWGRFIYNDFLSHYILSGIDGIL